MCPEGIYYYYGFTLFLKIIACNSSQEMAVMMLSVISWLQCRFSYLFKFFFYLLRLYYPLLCYAIMCLRGARLHQGCPLSLGALDLALADNQVAPGS